jgi:hypothetical protein
VATVVRQWNQQVGAGHLAAASAVGTASALGHVAAATAAGAGRRLQAARAAAEDGTAAGLRDRSTGAAAGPWIAAEGARPAGGVEGEAGGDVSGAA